jgi:hypothetical protein
LILASLLVGAALAGPSDEALTYVGGQGAWTQSLAAGDADLLVGERARWGLADFGEARALALADLRVTFDPDAEARWDQSRLRALGVRIESPAFAVDVGRSAIWQGGPRLVDGVQARATNGDWTFGAWGGLAPDLFTTRPMLRPGGGPIVAWTRGRARASLVGEALFAGGGLDRAGLLALASLSGGPAFETNGRLDLQLADAEGRFGLSEGAVTARFRPSDDWRFLAGYDAYTSLRYLRTEGLDPDVRRFTERLDALGVQDAVLEDLYDPRAFHFASLDAQWQPAGGLPVPRVGLAARYRYHPDPALRYARIGPRAGWVADRIEVNADATWLRTDAGPQEELGVQILVEPTSDGRLALDGSVRAIVPPGGLSHGPGAYGDLFVDWLAPGGFVVIAGASALWEPSDVADLGLAGFVRVQHRLRREDQSLETTRLP